MTRSDFIEGPVKGPPCDDPAVRRLEAIHRRYARTPRKLRAWSGANVGNLLMAAELRAQLLERVEDRLAEKEILDIGCGNGRWLEILEHAGADPRRLHGVELLADRRAEAQRRLPRSHVIHADARRLPYEADRFDVVLLFTVLSLLPSRADAKAALGEAMRVAAPGALVLIYEPRIPNPLNRRTRLVRMVAMRRALEGETVETTALTLLPPLARQVRSSRVYRRYARFRLLRTHRLVACVKRRQARAEVGRPFS